MRSSMLEFMLGVLIMHQGSMPTDGTLLMEHMPNGKQYLVTASSVFFSFGAVFAAVVGLLVLAAPARQCLHFATSLWGGHTCSSCLDSS